MMIIRSQSGAGRSFGRVTKSSGIDKSIPRYSIVTKLGEGGTGEVYLAHDAVLDRQVTLKFLRAESLSDPKARKRFIRGARAAARLAHPNILKVYEAGENGSEVFIVMEYVAGETLTSKILSKPLDPDECVDLAVQLADALAEAHQQGIVHRDIKPENIIVDDRGQAKLLDFGIAKAVPHERSLKTEAETQTWLTGPGMFVGTLVYASPEQLRRNAIDGRSDIFSFGLVMYEMLTGKRPFAAGSDVEEVMAILTREAPPLECYVRHVPTELKRIVCKCLEKDPNYRYQSAHELLIDLKKLKRDSETSLRSSRPQTASRKRGSVRRRKSINSIAVLPLTNANDDPDVEYLSDGITETLINSLSRIPKLKVMARSTVFRYKSELDDPRQVGSSLGVEAVLVGRVNLKDDQLKTSAELVDVVDGATLWGQQFNRGLEDIFVIQEEISSEITAGLRLKLTGEERKRLTYRYTENSTAYQLYLKGRFFWNRRTEEGLRKGIEHFELAIEADPAYSLAYAGLADCYNMLCWWNIVGPKEVLSKAKSAALKAIELDATLAEAHASAGAISETDWDWKAAGREYKCALKLNPKYAVAHQWYAEYLAITGQFDKALYEIKLAERLDPFCSIINTELGWILFLVGEYDNAIEQYRTAVELDPEFAAVHWRLSQAYLQQSQFDKAIQEIERAIELSGKSLQMLARLAYTYAVSGKRNEAQGVLNRLGEAASARYVSPYDIATVYAGLGDKKMALAWLERSYEEHSVGLTFLNVEPAYTFLRDDPRLTNLLSRIGLSM